MEKRVIALALALVAALCAAVLTESSGQPLNELPAVVGMNNRALGGACSMSGLNIWDYNAYKIPGDGIGWQWTKAGGCPNTGLLVKTWGIVKNTFYSPTTGAKWFHIDDGSRVTSDFTDTGILIYSDADVQNGQFVAVTGISDTEPALDMPDKLIRVLRTRTAEDIQVLREPKPLYPFSDEFDSEKLDWRWGDLPPYNASPAFSLSDPSGCLSVVLVPKNGNIDSHTLFQPIQGDWDMETKLRTDFDTNHWYGTQQGVIMTLSKWLPQFNNPDSFIVLAGVRDYSSSTPTAEGVYAAGDHVDNQAGTNWWFKCSKRGDLIKVSYSRDGVSYSPEYSTTFTSANYICFHAYCTHYQYTDPDPLPAMKVAVDYIHITPVSE